MTYDEVLDRFEVTKRGMTDSMARCPHHADGSASLSISAGKEATLVFCQAGCATADVLADVDLKFSDLKYEASRPKEQGRRQVATYPYVDENGDLLYEVVRYEPKDFRQRKPDGKGGWEWKLNGTRRVLFELPDVLAAIEAGLPVYVVEGEKDVRAAQRAGQVATCNVGGAGKWNPAYTAFLRGAHVRIVADNDDAGRAHAAKVAAELADVAAEVKVLRSPHHKDLADHLGAGLSLDDLEPLPADPDPPTGDTTRAGGDALPSFTDDANARRFVAEHGHLVRYVPQWGVWLLWDGKRWARDWADRVKERARQTARNIHIDALTIGDTDLRKRALRHAERTLNKNALDAMVVLSKSHGDVPVQADDLDADPYLFNVQNGTLDLRTGTLRPADPRDHLTKMAGTHYDHTATCPRFEQFLATILPDPDVRAFVQELVGYSLTGCVGEQILVFGHGTGANGKSTLLNVLLELMGEYGRPAEPDLLLVRDNAHPTGVADLQGARLVVSSEIEQGRKLAEATVKQLTGGDRIKARYMRQDFFEFSPTHKIIVAANHRPVVRGTDHAIWRRIRLIPFATVIDKTDQDPNLPVSLRSELPGVLRWAVDGCLRWQQHGLSEPEAVMAATADYRAEQDLIGAFIQERCLTNPSASAYAKDLYAAYTDWADDQGEKPMAMRLFGMALKERGFTNRQAGQSRLIQWEGIGVLTDRLEAALLGPNDYVTQERF